MIFSMALRTLNWIGVVRCVYISVERMLACPSNICTIRVSTPFSNNLVAKLCRKTWGVTSLIPAEKQACLNATLTEQSETWVVP